MLIKRLIVCLTAISDYELEIVDLIAQASIFKNIFSHHMGVIVFVIPQIFCNAHEKCLRTAYWLLRRIFFLLSVLWYDLEIFEVFTRFGKHFISNFEVLGICTLFS